MKIRVKLVIVITFGVLLIFYSLFRKYFFEFLSFIEIKVYYQNDIIPRKYVCKPIF